MIEAPTLNHFYEVNFVEHVLLFFTVFRNSQKMRRAEGAGGASH